MSEKSIIKVERFHSLAENGPSKAFCDLLLMDQFIVKGLRVVQGKEGLFVSMPQQQGRDGKWYDTFYPVSVDLRKDIQDYVLDKYSEHKNRSDNDNKK